MRFWAKAQNLMMRKSRFTGAQIVAIRKELDAGQSATELARRDGVHANTIYRWHEKYAGPKTSDLAKMKQLEGNAARMQSIIARQTLERNAVRDVIEKSGWSPRNGKAS
jgi:putative transposase